MWLTVVNVEVMSIVVCVLGTISTGFSKWLERILVKIVHLQKTALLGTFSYTLEGSRIMIKMYHLLFTGSYCGSGEVCICISNNNNNNNGLSITTAYRRRSSVPDDPLYLNIPQHISLMSGKLQKRDT